MFDFEQLVRDYKSNENQVFCRLLAWDYMWDYVQSVPTWESLASAKNIRATALNLLAYLATFGMLRSSSQLLQMNIGFYEELVEHLFREIDGQFWRLTISDFTSNEDEA